MNLAINSLKATIEWTTKERIIARAEVHGYNVRNKNNNNKEQVDEMRLNGWRIHLEPRWLVHKVRTITVALADDLYMKLFL